MTADLFRELCEKNGLHCVSQELVNWRGRRLIDCLSPFVRSDSAPANPPKVIRNPNFMRECANSATVAAAGLTSALGIR